jgi:hypothetical protein
MVLLVLRHRELPEQQRGDQQQLCDPGLYHLGASLYAAG